MMDALRHEHDRLEIPLDSKAHLAKGRLASHTLLVRERRHTEAHHPHPNDVSHPRGE